MDVCWKLLCNGKLADSGFGMAFRSFVSPCLFFRVSFEAKKLLVSNPQHHAPCRRPTEDPFDETLRGVTASHHMTASHHRIKAVFWLQKECCKTPLPLHLLYVLALPPLWRKNPAKWKQSVLRHVLGRGFNFNQYARQLGNLFLIVKIQN